MQSRLLLDVVIRESTPVLELLSGKNETLLIGRDTFLVLDLGLDVVDRVRRLNIERDSLTSQRLDEDLHSSAKTEDQVQSRLLLDVVIRESTPVLELLSGKNETLLIRRDTFLVLDLGLDVVDRVRRLNIERDSLTGQRLDEDLHSSAKTKDQVQSRLFLDVVIRERTPVLELLSGENETLLIGRDTFLVLDLGLDVVDRVRGLNIERDSLTGQRLDEDLHSSAKTKDQVQSRLLLDVVIRESTPVLELLSGKNETLLIRRDTFLVLDLGLDVVDRVRRLNIERDSLTSQRLDEDLHSSAKTKDQVQSRLLLDVVIRERTPVLELLSGENETLLIGRDTFLVLDLGLDVVDRVRRLNIERDSLTGQRLDEDLHSSAKTKDQVQSRLLLNVVI